MDFNFTEEQTLLRESLSRYLAAEYDFDKRKAMIASQGGRKPETWAAFAEMGLLAAPLPEAYGGLGGGPVDLLVIMEEFGRGLVIEPLVETVALSARMLVSAGSEAQRSEFLPKIAEGALIVAAALYEPSSRYALHDVTTTARKEGAGYVLSGRKAVVRGAPWADKLIVAARTAGERRDRDGVSLFILSPDAKGLTMREYPTVDGARAAELLLEDVVVGPDALLGAEGQALSVIEEAVDHATAAICAEAVGVMRATHETTLEYARARKQFGQALASFQVLQHRMVDMFIALEQSTSLAYFATLRLDEPAPARAKAVSAAKSAIARHARFVGQSAVQIHGGMGVTDEMRVAHLFKRLTMIESQFGDAEHHLKRYAALSK